MMSKYKGIGLVLAIILLVLLLYIPDFIFRPGDVLMMSDGDGLKNYYTFLYYVRWDDSIKMTGMAYPFGEHIVFTDAQPVLAKSLSLLKGWGIDMGLTQCVAIMHLVLLLSLFISAILIYTILDRLNLPVWYKVIVTVVITLMSPQLYRFAGHFALAIMFFVPLLWYLLIVLYSSKRKYLYGGLIFITILLFGYIHPYYLPIGALLVSSYAFVYYLQHRKTQPQQNKWFLYVMSCAVVPMVVFQLWMKWTDVTKDRPQAPYGLMTYRATFDGVFLAPVGPEHEFINYFMITRPVSEGWAYVGSVGLLVLVFSVIRVYKWAKKKEYKKIVLPPLPPALQTAVWAAAICILVAMAFPFRLWMEWTLDFLPPLKQFRSLGRFAWVFFYLYTIYVAYYVFQLFRLLSQRHKQFGMIFISVVLVVWASESWVSLVHAFTPLKSSAKNTFKEDYGYNQALKAHSLSVDSFQAILPLPFYLAGTEKIDANDAQYNSSSFVISYQTGLPISTLLLSRFSLSNGQKIKQLLSADEIEKELIKQYPDNRPLLVLYSDEYKLNVEEGRLLEKCDSIGRIKGGILYRLNLSKLSTRNEILAKYQQVKPQLIDHKGLLYTSEQASLIIPLDRHPFEKKLLGSGVLITDKDDQELFSMLKSMVVGKDSLRYEISLWMYLDPKISEVTGFDLYKYRGSSTNGKLVETINVRQEQTYDIYKGWQRISIPVYLASTDYITLSCSEKGITLDDILIKPVGTAVYKTIGDSLLYRNNYLIRMD